MNEESRLIQVVIGQIFLILAHRTGCKTRKFVMIFTPIHIPEYGSGALPEGFRMKPLSITPSRVTSEYHKFATRSFSIPELWVVVENVLLVLLAENAMHLLELIWWCKGKINTNSRHKNPKFSTHERLIWRSTSHDPNQNAGNAKRNPWFPKDWEQRFILDHTTGKNS